MNKGTSVACYESTAPSLKGWRVLYVDKDTKTVTLVHAGQPECYNHSYSYDSVSVANLNDRGSQYVNDSYATLGRSINRTDANKIDATNDLKKIGAVYYLADDYLNYGNCLYGVNADGSINNCMSTTYGFRPVIVLK